MFADEQLMATAGAKINTTGDVILTFAASSIVLAALLQAHQVHHHRRLACLYILKTMNLSSRTWGRQVRLPEMMPSLGRAKDVCAGLCKVRHSQ